MRVAAFHLLCAAGGAVLLTMAGCTSQDAGNFVKAARERAKQPVPVATPQTRRKRPFVYIDVAVLAARHPAWRLAAALEHSGKSVTLSSIQAPSAPQTLELSNTPLQGQKARLPLPANGTNETTDENSGPLTEGAPGYSRPPQRITARDTITFEETAHGRQDGAFTDFLDDVANRQKANREDVKKRRSIDLEDEIEAAQRLTLANLQPLLPPPDVQLEMTNLRLKLLPNAPIKDSERASAALRLQMLEKEWAEALREQENTRLEELKRLQLELPLQMREIGLSRIDKNLLAQAERDEQVRGEAAQTLRERVEAGFNTKDGQALSITLPGADLPAQNVAGAPLVAYAPHRFNKEINSTNPVFWSSVAPFAGSGVKPMASVPGKTAGHGANNQRVAALRRQAWQEAQRWALTIAHRQGWRLQTSRTNANKGVGKNIKVPDRTSEALQLLDF